METMGAYVKRYLVPLVAAGSLAACGRPFHVKTAPSFIELDQQSERGFLYRATTPEGVVVGVRVIEDEARGDLGFWVHAVTLQLRDVQGYELIRASDTKSRDGTAGKRLEFGHDESSKPYLYEVTVFRAQGRVYLIEAGGMREQVERARANIDWMLASVEVRCPTVVSPVLASRTCNRW